MGWDRDPKGLNSKCWPIVTDDGGSVDTLHYKLGVSDFKCEDCCPDSNHTLSSTSLTQWEARGATRLEDMKPGFLSQPFTPSFRIGLTVPNFKAWAKLRIPL